MESYKIILIDDSEWELYFHQELLSLNGIENEVISFSLADQALNYLNHLNHDAPKQIILCDIHMPGMNGFEFADSITNLPFFIKDKIELYFLSSTLDSSELEKAKTYNGVKTLFNKPLNIPLFKTKINYSLQAPLNAVLN